MDLGVGTLFDLLIMGPPIIPLGFGSMPGQPIPGCPLEPPGLPTEPGILQSPGPIIGGIWFMPICLLGPPVERANDQEMMRKDFHEAKRYQDTDINIR